MERSDVQRLLDLEQIRELKARYCRFIDTKQWQLLRSLFTDGARFEGFRAAPTGADADTFVRGVSTRLKDAISVHHCHTPEIVFTDASTARGIWAMMDYLEWPSPVNLPEAPEAPAARGFYGFGHYEEEYRKIGDDWKMHFLRLTRMRIDPLPEGRPAPGPVLLAASPGWLNKDA